MSLASVASSTATDALAAARKAANAPGASDGQLGQDQFMTLMLTQLKNQDPLKPLEPSEFLGQLAQFSSVTGIQGMKDSVAALAGSLRSSQVLEGSTLVGRSVLAASGTARLDAGGAISGAAVAPEGASSVDVTIRDGAGAIVRQLSVVPRDGLTSFSWDGLDSRGGRAPAGLYRVDTVARAGSRTESLETLIEQRVDSVSIDQAAGLTLNTSSGALALGDVRRVK